MALKQTELEDALKKIEDLERQLNSVRASHANLLKTVATLEEDNRALASGDKHPVTETDAMWRLREENAFLNELREAQRITIQALHETSRAYKEHLIKTEHAATTS